MRPKDFVNELSEVRLPGVFNPYADQCTVADLTEAPRIRRQNLSNYLEAARPLVDSVWLGRDLGYRGGRRTGLALTDEFHLSEFSETYGGVTVRQATNGPPLSERTASTVWAMLRQLPRPPFLWNIFPFHPHEQDDPMSNRCHTAAERRLCAPLIRSLLNWLKPEVIVAIGTDAHKALQEMGYECRYVRHPSYGGQGDFVRGLSEIYGLPAGTTRQAALI